MYSNEYDYAKNIEYDEILKYIEQLINICALKDIYL